MAFAASGLALVEQQIGGKYRKFDYRTTDSVATVTGTDYITNASTYGLVEGDVFMHIKTDDNPVTVTRMFVSEIDASDNATVSQALGTALGAQAAQPASGTVTLREERNGSFFALHFTLTAAQIPVTDAAGSGSSGSLKLYDFAQGGIIALGGRQDYTAFAEGAALTGAAGDAAFVMGVGSAAANAGDAALTGTEVDWVAITSTITLSGGTGTGTKHSCTAANVDGTATAADIYLNWSGSAATIDANSTIDVTGTVTVVGVLVGDD
jgi:hypothetical protein